ncbi:MAG TPA: deoxyguanosinetriphosphate triphosphohydrolase [Thiotrichaceae bacterium]|nr:deoxyguanosinetriphosphate triphosphohydrolase [Thiotrichaceae bacterium]HIM07300.1 deoxyguanosinetriphosphate triphosphohydrolase [Gammaproteobacteria bacterium]
MVANELAIYAARSENSKGRVHKDDGSEYRNEYQRDRDRIIHSSAFRRLEYKTQVFVNHEGDMFRTRLTHSIEVAQIGRTIARALNVNEDLTEAICLAHDLGHTPFGHAGQDALNACMKDYGGFEHNLQSLKIVDLLEKRYAIFPGLNLTFETREGILKHCSKNNAKTLGIIGERFINNEKPGIEAQIANIADEIAYNNHDIDDGLRAGLLDIESLRKCELVDIHYKRVKEKWPDLSGSHLRHEIIRRMINYVVSDLIETSEELITSVSPIDIDDVRKCGKSLIRMSKKTESMHKALKKFLHDNLYRHERVNLMAEQAKETIDYLFNAYMTMPELLTDELQAVISSESNKIDKMQTTRLIADYIAGMTDRFAFSEHDRISSN